jgi:hypothetical protein
VGLYGATWGWRGEVGRGDGHAGLGWCTSSGGWSSAAAPWVARVPRGRPACRWAPAHGALRLLGRPVRRSGRRHLVGELVLLSHRGDEEPGQHLALLAGQQRWHHAPA